MTPEMLKALLSAWLEHSTPEDRKIVAAAFANYCGDCFGPKWVNGEVCQCWEKEFSEEEALAACS